jgi:hypothetical protein
MNKLEADFEQWFLMGKPHGFEQIKLRLADKTYYTPDFWVLGDDDVLEFHETKGGPWMDDARVKIKVAAERYPQFRFRAWRYVKGVWHTEPFGPEDICQ